MRSWEFGVCHAPLPVCGLPPPHTRRGQQCSASPDHHTANPRPVLSRPAEEEPVRVGGSAGPGGHAGPAEGSSHPPGAATSPTDGPARFGRSGVTGRRAAAAGSLRAGPVRDPQSTADPAHPLYTTDHRRRPADPARPRRPHPRRADAEVRHAAARQRSGGCPLSVSTQRPQLNGASCNSIEVICRGNYVWSYRASECVL